MKPIYFVAFTLFMFDLLSILLYFVHAKEKSKWAYASLFNVFIYSYLIYFLFNYEL